MPQFLPFPGIRYRSSDISAVSAPPYDVIEPEARAALEARDAHNSVRLILPDSYDAAANALLSRLRVRRSLNSSRLPIDSTRIRRLLTSCVARVISRSRL